MLFLPSGAEFLNLNTLDNLSQILLCWGGGLVLSIVVCLATSLASTH